MSWMVDDEEEHEGIYGIEGKVVTDRGYMEAVKGRLGAMIT